MLTHQTFEDINHKYAKSILWYKGEPVMIGGAYQLKEGMGLSFTHLGKTHLDFPVQQAPASDPGFADGPFNVGYINGTLWINEDGDAVDACTWAARVPLRRFKQGLSSENLWFKGGNLSYNTAIKLDSFVLMLKNQYPNYATVAKKLSKKVRTMAYARRWALSLGKLDQIELAYRGQLVGMGDDPDHVKLAPKFKFLDEVYQISKQA